MIFFILFISALAALEFSRGIKPFASGGPRPFGVSVPTLSHPNPPVTVIQGVHKPIAITAPQPHVSNPESRSQTSINPTISVSDDSVRINNEDKSFSKLQYTSSNYATTTEKLLLQEGFQQDIVRYVTQAQESDKNVIDNSKLKLIDNTCFQCKKVFKTKAALKLHTTVHKTSDERQYECPLCHRRFLHRHHLVVHQRKHSGEKPFKCNACGKTFMAIFLLHKHLRKHIRESGPNCQIASEQLTRLHIKKDTMDLTGFDNVSLAIQQEMPTKNFPENGSLIVLDDGDDIPTTNSGKFSQFNEMSFHNKNKYRLDNLKNSAIEVIDLSSDDFNSSHGSGDGNNFSLKTPFTLHTTNLEKQKFTSQDTYQNGPNGSGSLSINSEAKVTATGSECLDRTGTICNDNQGLMNIKSRDSIPNMTETKKNVDKTGNLNPIPIYSADDEVELDFQTGELKILSKPTVTNCEPQNVDGHDTLNYLSNNTFNNVQAETLESSRCQGQENKYNNTDQIVDELNGFVNLTHVKGEINSQTHLEELSGKDNLKVNNCTEGRQNKSHSEHDLGSFENTTVLDLDPDNTFKEVNINEQDVSRDICENYSINEAPNTSANAENIYSSFCQPEDPGKEMTDLSSASVSRRDGADCKKRKGKKCKTRVKRVKCDICSRTFHSNHHLILHMAVHKKNQMLYSLKKAKAQQIKSMGYQQQKTNVVCNICKKVFKFQKSLNSHMRVHSEKLAKQKLLSKAFRDFMLEATPSSRTADRTLSSGSVSESPSILKHNDSKEKCVTSDENDKITNSNTESQRESTQYLAQYSKDDRLEDPPIKVIIGKDNIKRFLCHACDNTYTTKQKLRMHALVHKDNCFLCDICGKSFFRLLTLEKHIATHRLPRPHVCGMCKKSFIHRSSLMRHRVIHEKPNPPTAKQQVEDISFELKMLDTYTMLRQERLKQLQSTNLAEVCVNRSNSSKSVETENEMEVKNDILDLSVRIKTDDVSLPPVLSPANTPNSIQNSLHLSPPVITDETCQSKKTEEVEPATVYVKHEPVDNITKEENQAGFGPLNTTLELRRKRNSDEQLVPCDVNNDAFRKKIRKTRVYQTSCRVCKEPFPNVMSLKSHMLVHNMVETHLYECSICHHRFTQSCSLLRHLKTSCQENRLKCLPCGKTFHQKNSYDQHMKLHTGLPSNLDGSFYDKRRDEVEGIQVKEERESDVENNNTKNFIPAQNPIKVEFISTEAVKDELVPMKCEFQKYESVKNDHYVKPGPSGLTDTNYDSDASDNKTYLYSEGEGRMKDLTDFSDFEEISGRTGVKKVEPRPLSVDSGSSSTVMTLNLLSAVCSDIRNAEKEEETRRKEMEERQKELETIEILANLKRGRMQNTATRSAGQEEAQNTVSQSYMHFPVNTNSVMPSSGHNNVTMTEQSNKSAHESEKYGLAPKYTNIISPNQSKTESRNILNVPQIPTVVFEIAAEAERLRQERLAKLSQVDLRKVSGHPDKDNVKSVNVTPQAQFLQGLSQMTLNDRLSLLMKAQIPPSPFTFSSSGQPHPPLHCNTSMKSSTTHSLSRPQSVPTVSQGSPLTKNISKLPPEMMPQDLSMKKHSMFQSSVTSVSRPSTTSLNSSSPAPSHVTGTGTKAPPLVPVFHCELCGQLIYNQMEYQQHLKDHLHAIQLKGHNLIAQSRNSGQRSWFLDRAQSK